MLCVVRSLRRADPSSTEVLPCVCVCVCVRERERSSATITFSTCNEYVGEVRQRRNVCNILGDASKCVGIILVIGVMNEQAVVKHTPPVEFNNRTCI